jgi:hypothetical protein
MPAHAFFTALDKQSGPFQRMQDAGGERSHLTPCRIVPVMLGAIKGCEHRSFVGAVVRLDIHPDIPFSEGTIFKSGVGRVLDLDLDLENKEADELGKLKWSCFSGQVCGSAKMHRG